MLLSTKSRYGLRLLVCLARRYGDGLLAVDDLSASEDISGNYIHLLLASLRGSGLVRSVRGRSGGYELSRPPDEISLLEIVTALEGHHLLVECGKQPDLCGRSSSCSTRRVWRKVADAMEDILRNMSLQQLLEDSKCDVENLHYCI